MFSMADLVHLHFLLNHFPSIGLLVAFGIFVLGLVAKSDHLQRAAMVFFVLIALAGLPAYVTGNVAAASIDREAGVSKASIEAHEGLALVSLAVLELVGVFAWLGLWQHRRFGRIPVFSLMATLITSLVAFALMAQTSNVGGEIRHPEILAKGVAASGGIGPFARNMSSAFKSLTWGWAAAETVHFIGLCLIMGVTLLLNLRLLGLFKGASFASLHRYLPWAIMGFAVNTITGMLFFASSPANYVPASIELLLYKLLFILLAGANALYFTVLDDAWAVGAGDAAPGRVKFMAGAAIFLWLAVIYCGSMLPFIGGAF
jgi:uncharacterized membrane protein